MKKLLIILTVTAMINLGAFAGAHAFNLTGVDYGFGFVNFDFIGADKGTTYTAPGSSGFVVTNGDGVSDSWGIGNVVSIYQNDFFNPLWTPSGDTIDFVFGGLDDHSVYYDTASQNWSVKSQSAAAGSYLNIYYDPSPAATNYAAGPGAVDPAGDGSAWDVGNGVGDELLLSLQFVPGVISGDNQTVLAASFEAGWGQGSGLGYLEVVGGSWKDQFDSNAFLNGSADFQFEYSAGDLLSIDFLQYGWTVEVDGISTGKAVPIPASIWLLGSCLLGFIGLGRRRFTK